MGLGLGLGLGFGLGSLQGWAICRVRPLAGFGQAGTEVAAVALAHATHAVTVPAAVTVGEAAARKARGGARWSGALLVGQRGSIAKRPCGILRGVALRRGAAAFLAVGGGRRGVFDAPPLCLGVRVALQGVRVRVRAWVRKRVGVRVAVRVRIETGARVSSQP